MATALDRDLAIRAVLAEAGSQGPVGQMAVAHVIRNRMASGRYGGNDARGVVLAKNQFEPFNHFGTGHENDPARFHPSDPAYQEAGKIVDAVMTGQLRDPTGGATHFYAPVAQAQLAQQDGRALTPSWAKGPHVQIGGHMFFSPDDPNGLDLSQSFGKGGQKPGGSFDMADATSNAGGQSAGAGGPGASAWPSQPSMGAAPAPQGTHLNLADWFRQQASAGQPQQRAHGMLNQLLFGQQGWQQHMPQGGLLSALFQKFGQGGGGQGPAGAPMQLPGAQMQPQAGALSPTGPAPQPGNISAPTPGAPSNAFAGGQGGGFLSQLLASLAAGGGNGAA